MCPVCSVNHAPRPPQAEVAGLKKQLGLSAGDANHARFQTSAGGSGLSLSEYFEWAEVNLLPQRKELHVGVGGPLIPLLILERERPHP